MQIGAYRDPAQFFCDVSIVVLTDIITILLTTIIFSIALNYIGIIASKLANFLSPTGPRKIVIFPHFHLTQFSTQEVETNTILKRNQWARNDDFFCIVICFLSKKKIIG